MSPFLYDKSFHLEMKRREECFPLSPDRPAYVPSLAKLKCNITLAAGRSLAARL